MENLFILILCSIFVYGNCWVGIIQADPNTAHLGDCYTTIDNIGALKVGEVKRIEGQCAIATCGTDGDIGLTGCSPIAVMPPYKVLPGDLSKPFPECCHEIVGPSNSTGTDPEDGREVNPSGTFVDISSNQI